MQKIAILLACVALSACAGAREGRDPIADAIVVSSVLNKPNPFATSAPAISVPTSRYCYRVGNMVQCN